MNAVLRRLAREDGQGLIELIVALTILAVGIGAVLTVLTASSLSLQRSDQKGTALSLAETQLELYRNLSFTEIRLADASFGASPLTDAADPYNTANSSDPSIPSGAKADEYTDTAANTVPCASTPPPECQPVRTVTGPDHRLYRIDTYITNVTPTADGTKNGTPVGDTVKQVTVVVRNAQLSTLPILARNSSTFSPVNAAAFTGRAIPNIALDVPQAWTTSTRGTTIQASDIGVNLSNMLPNPTNTDGVLTIWAYTGAIPPAAPCATGAGWTQVGTATIDNGNTEYFSNGDFTVAAGNTYWWYAHFTGDSANEDRDSRCSPAMTTTVVQANPWTPSISISAPASATTGVQVDASKISAKLTNASPGATGTIHIRYGTSPSACGSMTELGTALVTGSGSYSQGSPFSATPAGTYYWYASYDPNGDKDNVAATSVCSAAMPSTVVDAGPGMQSMQMKDTNGNGKIDQVVVTFNKNVSCSATCTKTGWTLSNAPGGATLASVATSTSTATLTLNEGAADTSAGLFQVTLDTSAGIVDAGNRAASFAATPPVDKAGPVLVTAKTTNGGSTSDKMEQNDTMDLTFSEPLAPGSVPGAVTVTEQRSAASVTTLTIPNIIQSASINKAYLSKDSTAATATGTVTLTNANKTIHIVLGAVSVSGSGTTATGNKGAVLAPCAAITDAATTGVNAAVTTSTATSDPLF
jgi:type II secretory pathway pseudopilin PulG